MGMDVYGTAAANADGEYFRNNVWWWRPLWDYCESLYEPCTEISGHINDGEGLTNEEALELASILKKELDSGEVAAYAEARAKRLSELEDETCIHCQGTGVRKDLLVAGGCNGCKGSGKVRPFATWYPFSEENVREFVKFLENCGGFEIC